MEKIKNYFFEEIDNSALIIFRILLGFLLAAEGIGAILTGWVQETFIDANFNFTAIGLEWMQAPPFIIYTMYISMSLLGICIMLGFKYRISTTAYFIIWTCSYSMQKSHYNNHYYLIVLLSAAMIIMPAHRYFSLDVKKNPALLSTTCPRWTTLFFIFQLLIVYSYASAHKVYPDWLAAKPIHIWFTNKATYPELLWLKDFLLNTSVQKSVAYLGILYDGLIIPALLWKRTRWLGIFASFGFHLFNSLVFQIGVFPYLSLTFLVFFFEPKVIQNRFFRSKQFIETKPSNEFYKNYILAAFVVYFIIQILLPIRHNWIEGNVFWTEEGHKMSWRMMLRSKSGNIHFTMKQKNSDKIEIVEMSKYFTNVQRRSIAKNPDMTWQAAQYLRKEYEKQGIIYPQIYAHCFMSLNGSRTKPLIDDKVDLAHTPWNFFTHNSWIYSYNFEK